MRTLEQTDREAEFAIRNFAANAIARWREMRHVGSRSPAPAADHAMSARAAFGGDLHALR